jgi:hypothetical protein
MTPQHSCLPWRPFRHGMTFRAYVSSICSNIHISAYIFGKNRFKKLAFHALFRSLDHWILRTLHRLSRRLFYQSRLSDPPVYPPGEIGVFKYLILGALGPPGTPPLLHFSNYFKTKNRPFFDSSSWAVPMTWRSSGRKSLYHFLNDGTNRLGNWFQQGRGNLLTTIKVPK